MFISDLEHLEVVSEEISIVGAGGNKAKKAKKANAYADADATAIGSNTYAATYTNAVAIAGIYSQSTSSSVASAKTEY